MRRLLEDFEALFDLNQQVGDARLGDLIERAVSDLDRPRQNWGTAGRRDEVFCESGRFVSFYYRPHLFPGMDTKLRLAHELQYRLLPRKLPADSPVSISAILESYCHLSGDLFGWEMLKSGKILIWIADMAGHGLRSGLASAVLRVLIGTLREREQIDGFVSELNQLLHDCIRPKHDGLFATLFVMTLDRNGKGAYCSAGHPPVLSRRPDGEVDELLPLDIPIGLFADTAYRSRTFRLERDASLLLYTDGLVEARAWDDESSARQHLKGFLKDTSRDPRRLTQTIYDEIEKRQNIDELDDDVTFLAVQF